MTSAIGPKQENAKKIRSWAFWENFNNRSRGPMCDLCLQRRTMSRFDSKFIDVEVVIVSVNDVEVVTVSVDDVEVVTVTPEKY